MDTQLKAEILPDSPEQMTLVKEMKRVELQLQNLDRKTLKNKNENVAQHQPVSPRWSRITSTFKCFTRSAGCSNFPSKAGAGPDGQTEAQKGQPVKEEELKSFAVDFDNKDQAPAVGPLAPLMRCRSATPPPLASSQSRCPILMMPIAGRAGGTGATKSSCRVALEGEGHPAEGGNIAGQSGAEGSGQGDEAS
ncbi:GL26520 [Drosophila persimilis]|uniref:GL26520 n=1 Tax=Drosophila persimilis TaxID=7234 RepID=B4GSD7_DROPE|nr:GL26520 [Drosophila persimilis]